MNSIFLTRDFFLLWLGRFISQAGDRFYGIALAWWLLTRTGSPALMGLFLMASTLPGLLAALLAGPVIDRLRRRSLLIAADLVRGAVVTGIACLAMVDALAVWHVLGAAILISLASAVFDPASQALIPSLVDQDAIPRANALGQLGSGVCMVAGPALGGLAVASVGYTLIFGLNAASYFFCAGCALRIRTRESAGRAAAAPYRRELAEGLAFVLSRGWTLLLIGAVGAAHFFTAGMMLAIPFLADLLPGAGARNLGWLEMCMGGGFVLGSLVAPRIGSRLPRGERLFRSLLLAGLCMISVGGFAGAGSGLWPCLAGAALYGAAIANASVVWLSLLQMSSPPHLAGRVLAIMAFAGNISMPIAYGLLGPLLQRGGLPPFLVASGAALAFLSLPMRWRFRHTPPPPGPEPGPANA